jgi:hypothetical protein
MRLIIFIAFMVLSIAVEAANPVIFKLNPIKLTNGWNITGTITTDGTIGALSSANILDWNMKIVQTTDIVWTEKDSSNPNISGVSTDGKKIHVATSPDGVQVGGSLYFGRGGAVGTIPTSAVIADFTDLSTNLGYVGGMAGWQDELGGLNYIGLNLRNNIQYHAASAVANQPNVFRISVPTLATNPILMTMFGTITTDGTIGPLLPKNIIAWKVTARNQDISYFTKTNSTVISANGISTDGNVIKVNHDATSLFTIGVGGRRPTFVTLADFTDVTLPNGFANYYTGIFGVMGDKSPLVGAKAVAYTFAKRQ